MRYPPSLLDDIRARLPVSQVVARKVALKRSGRELKGLSPFKVEKTPSFFVNDHKGFYHCFASGEHGDIFKFVMQTEGLSFSEAVERLASEAGVAMPKAEPFSPAVREREDERVRLGTLMETAARFFESRLLGGEGQAARAYIERRGLTPETIARFRIGYAPAGRSAIKEHLAAQGFTPAEMVASGMLIGGDDIKVPYDRFRDRVMFPIADLKGRVIAFGGRALAADVPAKYLNSPETPLFHKGNVLFNAARARGIAHERGQVIAVEGYIDVIALDQGGFGNAVAPLGTALTEAQIQLLWRMSPEPILCFDGDGAGRKAAFRAIDVVLPLLQPGYSLNFAFLPNGLDPDDLVRQQGPAAFAAVLGRKRALFDVLWQREHDLQPTTTPEQRAAFEARIKALVARIGDGSVRQHYEQELRQTLWTWSRAVVRQIGGGNGGRGGAATNGRRNNANPQADWRLRDRARLGMLKQRSWAPQGMVAGAALAEHIVALPAREALLLLTLVNHPWLLEEQAEVVAGLELTSPPLAGLRDALLSLAGGEMPLDSRQLRSQLTHLGSDKVVTLAERAITHRSDKFAAPSADRVDVESGWHHAVALHARHVGLRRALEAAETAWHSDASEQSLARIVELKRMLDASLVSEVSTEAASVASGPWPSHLPNLQSEAG